MRAPFLVALIVFAVAVCAFADTVYLKDGRKLEGEIVREGEETIELKMKYGTMTIDRGDIERIEKTQPAKEEKSKPEKPEENPQPPEKQQPGQAPQRQPTTEVRIRKIKRLITRLGDSTYRNRAAEELEKIGTPAVQLLTGALQEPYVASHAATLLGKIGDKGAVEPLIATLRMQKSRYPSLQLSAMKEQGEI